MITTERESLVLARLAGPMAVSMLGLVLFNLIDTYFVGQLGSVELAALSFSFPLVMVMGSLAHGLGAGIAAAISRAAGEDDFPKLSRTATWGLVLALVLVGFFAIAGYITITPLFSFLGASGCTLEAIRAYMQIWYPGVIFMVVPMAGMAVIQGMGDTRTTSRIVLISILMNTILDPVLIFGMGSVKGMGVAGAALATVIARGASFLAVLCLLTVKHGVLRFRPEPISAVAGSLKEIMVVGLPSILSRLILPIASGLVTVMVAAHGSHAVAGLGIAVRIELFAMLAVNALVAAVPIFVGQNLGAGHSGRVLCGIKAANKFSLMYGAAVYILILAAAKPVVHCYSTDPDVAGVALVYLWVIPPALGFLGMMQLACATLNVLKRPVHSTGLILAQVFILYFPVAWISSPYMGPAGIFAALAFSYLIAGLTGCFFTFSQLKKYPHMG